jgi:hypothetical protein
MIQPRRVFCNIANGNLFMLREISFAEPYLRIFKSVDGSRDHFSWGIAVPETHEEVVLWAMKESWFE